MTVLVGILNLTPDSFSDGSKILSVSDALDAAAKMRSAGAQIIDVGGESTRPGSARIDPLTEQQRIIETIQELAAAGHTVSVDTVNAGTAAAAVAAGAVLINDVSGGLHDEQMLSVVARSGAQYIIGHWRGFPKVDESRSCYQNVTAEVCEHLRARAAAALAAGVSAAQIIIDPGLGFDKTAQQCWQILREIDALTSLGYRVLVGASRKRMIASAIDPVLRADSAPEQRDLASAVVTALCSRAGVWGVRVHDVQSSAQALAVANAWGRSQPPLQQRLQGTQGEQLSAQQRAEICSAAEKIKITGLKIYAHHGVFEHEKRDGQNFYIDCEITLQRRSQAVQDDIGRTVNYAEAVAVLSETATAHTFDLIESLAAALAQRVLRMPGAAEVTVTVHKPEAPVAADFADIAVTVQLMRADNQTAFCANSEG